MYRRSERAAGVLLRGRAEGLPLPVAEEGRLSAPQPRLWRAVAKQARERHRGKVGTGPLGRFN